MLPIRSLLALRLAVAASIPVLFGTLRAQTTPACCSTKPTPSNSSATEQPAGHPLKGVVIDVLTEKRALLVKHEEIPGIMRAMTMVLRVDDATLAQARKDQAIRGLLVRKDSGWWLEAVRSATD